VAEGGGLLNRYRVVKPYRGFESLRLRHPHHLSRPDTEANVFTLGRHPHIIVVFTLYNGLDLGLRLGSEATLKHRHACAFMMGRMPYRIE
jgi:hypothetical protein